MPSYKQSGTFQHRAAVNHQLQPFAHGDGDLPLAQAGQMRDPALASFDQTKEKNLPRFQALNLASARIDTHGGTP